MSSILSRFQIIEGTPPCAPGKCAGCGTTAGPFIDFGLELDFYGVVYLCFNDCFREVAREFKYIPPEEAASLDIQIHNLTRENADLTAYNKELQDVVDAFSRLRSDGSGFVPGQLAMDFSESEESELQPRADESSDEVIPEQSRKSTRRKSRSSQQDDEQGSPSIHSDASIDTTLTDSI